MRGRWMLVVVLLMGFLLGLAVAVNQAQGPVPQNDIPAGGVESGEPDEEQDIGNVEPAAVSSIIPIQGRLTDSAGNPLDGWYSVTARIYAVSTGGLPRCEDTQGLNVDKGLFNMDMENCDASDMDGEQLYLGIEVGSDGEMAPRQPINPVPYAWTVKPGAIIRGATTYLFTPGSAFVKQGSGDSTKWYSSGGEVQIQRGASPGDKTIFIPITVPGVLYGRDVRISEVRVSYQCQNGSNNYITGTQLILGTSASSSVALVVDTTDRVSESATSYSLVPNSGPYTLSSNYGRLALKLELAFANDDDFIKIGDVRLTLVTDY